MRITAHRWICAVLCAAALAGCVSTGGNVKPVDRDIEAIRDGVDAFLTSVGNQRYEALGAMIVRSQASGFNGEDFAADRFRMDAHRFQIIGWDRLMTKVTKTKDGSTMLSTAVVTVRDLVANEVKPVFVNLHWRREGAQWRILPYP